MSFIQSFVHISASCEAFMVSACDSDSHVLQSTSIELLLILDGSLNILPESRDCFRGDGIFLLPGTEVLLCSSETCVLLRITFPPEEFLHMFNHGALLLHPVRVINDGELSRLITDYGRFLLTGNSAAASMEASLLMPLFCRLYELITSELSEIASDDFTQKQKLLLKQILEYINCHYDEDISLSETASVLGITPQYLASFLKQSLGCTFLQYVQEIRCQMGDFYHHFTGLSTERICRRVGLSHHKLLLAYMQSHPSEECRKKKSQKTLLKVSQKKALQYLGNRQDPARALKVPDSYETITADIEKNTLFPLFWKRLINLGYASDFANIQLFNQLIRVQKEIGFTYGRICRLLDLITEYDINGKTFYDYNRIFSIFDVMWDNHLIPFLEISNKLFRIQLSISESVSRNHIKDTTGYFEHLLELLPGFIRACINRYGSDYVSTWRFEIGYNLYEFMETAEVFPLAKYIRYYQKIAAILHTYCKEVRIGGPGFNHWNNPAMLLDILGLFQSHHILPDFVTAYVYPVTSDDSSSSLSENENLTIERIETLAGVLRSRYPEMELWITEFNSTMSARNLLNDSSYQAVFLAKNLTSAVNMNVQAMGYYLLSDVPLRYVDSLDLLFGGWGLFSDSNLPKPAYHAYCMFSRLGKLLLKQHPHYLITGDSDSHFRCLFHHYEHIRSKYCRQNIDTSHLLSPEALFETKPDYRWEVNLHNARPGTYLVKEYAVSESQSNLLAEWNHIHFLTPAREDDLHALNLLSNVTPRIFTLECTDDSPLSFSITLEGHDIKMLIIDFYS